MKRRLFSTSRLSFPLASALAALLAALPAPAATYYWDNNGTTAGFGTASGTWAAPTPGSATEGWSTDGTGLTLPGNVTTTTADTINFGYYGLGLALGTITVTGTVNAGNFAVASGSGAIALPGGTINLADNASFTLTGNQVNLSTGAITNTLTVGSVLTGAATSLTQTGTGTLNLTAANPYTGRTVINGGGVSANFNVISTVGGISVSGNGTIASSSSFTLNNGVLTLANTNAAEALLDRVSNGAGITSNGGTIAFTNTAGADVVYAESLGAATLNGGQTNFVLTNTQTGLGSQTLTLGGLTPAGTAAATFSAGGGLTATNNIIAVTGATATPAGQIIGPWATTGTAANSLTDYAVYNAAGQVLPAAIAASAETTWTNSANAYTRNSGAAATLLTATRNINALRSINTASAATVNNTTEIITVAGSTFANGDPIALSYSNLGGLPGGLAHFGTYYVSEVSGTSFKVAATPAGPAINITSNGSGVVVSAGMLLPAGTNLGTLGILGGGTGHQLIAGDGAVTLPSTTSGNLQVTTGLNSFNGTTPSSAVIISAPITDNGTGVLTLVKNGAGNLVLSGTNTFSGGIVVNGGNLIWTTDANLGAANAPVTFNASSGLASIVASTSNRPFILNPGVMVSIASGGSGTVTLNGPVQGSGGISLFHGNAGTATGNLNSTANTFTGPIRFQGTNVNQNLNINSLADTAGAGNIIFGYVNGGAQTMTFNYGAGATAPMTLDNRRIELGAGPQVLQAINNSSTQALTINTHLLDNSTAVAKTLTLGGNGTGLSTFAGNIIQAASTLRVTKAGTGTWVLSGTNTYTGPTTINAGTLAVNGSGSINASAVTLSGGTLRYNSSVAYSNSLTFTSGTLGGTNLTGSLGGATIGTSRTLSPGNSAGTATTTGQTWAGGGTYLWEINNATGTAGSDPGWDLLSGTGTLDITATSGSMFAVNVASLTLANAAGLADNFNELTNYNWLIADFNAVTGFTANAFTTNTVGFANPFTGTFGVAQGGVGDVPGDNSQIYLTYTAVPEPGAALLGGLGLLTLLRRRRVAHDPRVSCSTAR
jgi:autotransporter-associated beta strand protein